VPSRSSGKRKADFKLSFGAPGRSDIFDVLQVTDGGDKCGQLFNENQQIIQIIRTRLKAEPFIKSGKALEKID
jgi:hypothetical protein